MRDPLPMAIRQVAIDGPAASGKSTAARLVAERLGGFYINTGDMYRTITREVQQNGIDPGEHPEKLPDLLQRIDLRYKKSATGSVHLTLNGHPVRQEDIRAPGVTQLVSFVARIPAVRDWLRDRQRETRQLGTIVMEGRDIGTVILPDATHKFFLIASPMERARRRLAQKGETIEGATLESVAEAIAERDRIDSSREVAPLRAAPDAICIWNDHMTPEQVRDTIVKLVEEHTS